MIFEFLFLDPDRVGRNYTTIADPDLHHMITHMIMNSKFYVKFSI